MHWIFTPKGNTEHPIHKHYVVNLSMFQNWGNLVLSVWMWMIFSLFEETETRIKAIIFQIRTTGTLPGACKIVLKDFALHLKFRLSEKISFLKITCLSVAVSVEKQWYCYLFLGYIEQNPEYLVRTERWLITSHSELFVT